MSDLYNNMISRQKEILDEKQQEILRTTPVAVVGCGGLGGTVIEQLVRAGFENLTIVDKDVFDETNLNRQVRSNIDTIGLSKVQSTQDFLKKINPDVNIDSYDMSLNEDNIPEVLRGNEIVIDAVDNVYTRVMISREARNQNIPFVHAAVEKTAGQLSIFKPNSISYEELFRLKSLDLSLSDAEDYLLSISKNKPQVFGFTPSIFASLEVSETIKYLLELDDVVLAPKVLMWDIFDITSFRLIDF